MFGQWLLKNRPRHTKTPPRPLISENRTDMANQKEQQQNLKLNINPEVAQGTYSNLVVISHNPTEIILDFAQMLPGADGAIVRQRVIMNPIHAKRTLAALTDNIRKYEQQFGTISEPRPELDTVPYDIVGKA